MSKKKDNKKGKGGSKSGGFKKIIVVMALLVGVGGAALWFLAPDQVQAQLDSLKNMLGL